MKNEIINALNWRFATKVFDKEKIIDEEKIKTILEAGRLSPSSLGLEPWKFILVKDPKVREQIFEASKQPKTIEASHLVVIAYKTNPELLVEERITRTAKIQNQKTEELAKYKDYLEKSVGQKVADGSFESWIKAQAYIPLGIMVEAASLLGIDNGPMEGFNNKKVDEILGLTSLHLKSVTMLALGQRGNDPLAAKPKIRRDFDDAVMVV